MRVVGPLGQGRGPRPPARSDVLQVLLDAPQSVGAVPQLGHLGVRQGHVDHAAHAAAVQHAGQRQEDLLADAVHVLGKDAHVHTQVRWGGSAKNNMKMVTRHSILSHTGAISAGQCSTFGAVII